jgi:plasmid stability protein
MFGANPTLDTSLIVPPLWRSLGVSAMAILNIKNFPDSLYRKLQARAKRQHRSVAQEVTQLLSDALETRKPLSILALKGLGKGHWRGVDPSKHVERERASWD